MLLDTRKKSTDAQEGFNPNVQNDVVAAGAPAGGLVLFILLSIITIGIFAACAWFGKRNKLNKMQITINQAASNIDVQLKQRADTLHKLVEASKSSVKFEKNLITDVTSLRSVKGYQPGDATTNANISKMDVAQAKILATLENYPKLESTTTIRELMQTADYLEREISATRRVYNASVSQFNGEIYTWPSEIVARHLKLHNLPFYIASEEDRKDVSLSIE